MSNPKTILMLVVAAVLAAALAVPAWAETVTTTTSFVNRFGNTVTVQRTLVDGVLTTQTSTEVMPDGTVKLARAWEYYPNGAVKTYEEERWSPVSPTHLYQEFTESGQLVLQQGEMGPNGEPVLVSKITFDPVTGHTLTTEERVLLVLADGTKVWEVTTKTYVDGVLASSETKQYPYDHDFDLAERPGYGHGDENHLHTGPKGKAYGETAAAETEQRPGNGYGDRNHDHQGKAKQ